MLAELQEAVQHSPEDSSLGLVSDQFPHPAGFWQRWCPVSPQ